MGILPDDIREWPRLRAEADRQEAATHARAQAAANLAAEQEATIDEIEQILKKVLGDDIQAEAQERAKRPAISTAHKAEFERFREYAVQTGLPCRPASPVLVAGYLLENLDRGPIVLSRMLAAIRAVHQRADQADPTRDLLPAALMRLARREKTEGAQ